jgi:hypothetical protein
VGHARPIETGKRRPSIQSWERIRQTLGIAEPLPEEAWRQQRQGTGRAGGQPWRRGQGYRRKGTGDLSMLVWMSRRPWQPPVHRAGRHTDLLVSPRGLAVSWPVSFRLLTSGLTPRASNRHCPSA